MFIVAADDDDEVGAVAAAAAACLRRPGEENGGQGHDTSADGALPPEGGGGARADNPSADPQGDAPSVDARGGSLAGEEGARTRPLVSSASPGGGATSALCVVPASAAPSETIAPTLAEGSGGVSAKRQRTRAPPQKLRGFVLGE